MMAIQRAALCVLCITVSATAIAANTRAENSKAAQQTTQKQEETKNDLSGLPDDLKPAFWLKPTEVIQTRERQLKEQNATYQPLRNVKAIQDIERIKPSSSKIPVVDVVPDYPSSVVFTDMTGKPWPIRYLAQTASVATVKKVDGSENSLVFYAKNHAGEKSVSIYLKGLSLPITLRIKGSEDHYHAVKKIQILERGPESQPLQLSSGNTGRSQFDAQAARKNSLSDGRHQDNGPSLDAVLNKLAYRVTPDGFKKLQVNDPETEAWIDKNDPSKLYMLTDHVISSPAPISGGNSVVPLGDGMRIYVLPRINPVMAVNESGERLYLTLKE